jgi:hypothetical protein
LICEQAEKPEPCTAHAPEGTLTLMAGLDAQETKQVKITVPRA